MSEDDFFLTALPSMSVDDEFVSPPVRVATPARDLPDLAAGTWATWGRAGCWMVDAYTVDRGPIEHDGARCYGVIPWPEWGASGARGGSGVFNLFRPISELWVYVDQTADAGTDEPTSPAQPLGWLERAQEATTPPLHRAPYAAREATTLIGMRLRTRDAHGAWVWVVATSEPREIDGDFYVSVVPVKNYAQVLYGLPDENERWHRRVLLHRLWAY